MPATERLNERRGAVAILTWFFGGWLVLTLLLLLGVGPTSWVSGWLNRQLGYDSPILAFILLFGAVSLPVVLLQLAPWQAGSAFLRGAQRALHPTHDPAFVFRRPSVDHIVLTLGRLFRLAACASALCLIAGLVGYRLMTRTPADAGKPIPTLSASQIIERAGRLPPYARLTGFAPGYRPSWVHLWTIRQSSYADLYFPIEAAGGPVRSPAGLIGKVHYDLSRGESPGSHPVLRAPMDGALETISLPGWMRQRMAERGFAIASPVILFTADDGLHGRSPGPDRVIAGFLLFLAMAFAILFAIIALGYAFRRHRLLKAGGLTQPLTVEASPQRRR